MTLLIIMGRARHRSNLVEHGDRQLSNHFLPCVMNILEGGPSFDRPTSGGVPSFIHRSQPGNQFCRNGAETSLLQSNGIKVQVHILNRKCFCASFPLILNQAQTVACIREHDSRFIHVRNQAYGLFFKPVLD